MDRKYIEENEIEIKYLRNQLTPEELEEFEIYLMENPEEVDSIQQAALLQNAAVPLSNNIKKKESRSIFWVGKLSLSSVIAACVLGLTAINISHFAFFHEKELQLYVVRSQSTALPSYEKGILERLLPIQRTMLILQPQVDDEKEYAEAKIYRLDSEVRSEGELITSVSGLAKDVTGQVLIPVDLSLISEGRFKLVLRESDGIDSDAGEAKRYFWEFEFNVE